MQHSYCPPDVPDFNMQPVTSSIGAGQAFVKESNTLFIPLMIAYSGVEMFLDIGVIDTTTCQAIPDILVEVWSSKCSQNGTLATYSIILLIANAVGEYGDNFLRGATTTNSIGIAEIDMIFPGVAAGAANHVNVIVHNKDTTTTVGKSTCANYSFRP